VFLCAGVLGALSLGALAQQPGPSAAVSAPTDAVLPPSTASAIPSAAPEPTPVPAPALDFSLPAPETGAVEDDWFSDAVFLGDSRSDGLRLYSGIRGADFLAYKSLMVFQVTGTGGVDAKAIPKNGVGDKKTALAWLEEKQYGKVYVMFGINACDVDTITVMGNAVNDCICQRTVITAELIIPFLKFILGAENR